MYIVIRKYIINSYQEKVKNIETKKFFIEKCTLTNIEDAKERHRINGHTEYRYYKKICFSNNDYLKLQRIIFDAKNKDFVINDVYYLLYLPDKKGFKIFKYYNTKEYIFDIQIGDIPQNEKIDGQFVY